MALSPITVRPAVQPKRPVAAAKPAAPAAPKAPVAAPRPVAPVKATAAKTGLQGFPRFALLTAGTLVGAAGLAALGGWGAAALLAGGVGAGPALATALVTGFVGVVGAIGGAIGGNIVSRKIANAM